jgi:hypothetical protein
MVVPSLAFVSASVKLANRFGDGCREHHRTQELRTEEWLEA